VDVTPNPPTKRARRKAKATAETEMLQLAAKPRKARARKTRPVMEASSSDSVAVSAPSPDELKGMIATAAYYLAEQRGFSPGHELDDWLEAERRVRAALFD